MILKNNIVVILFFFFSLVSCNSNEKKTISSIPRYAEKDFDLMRKTYLSDSVFMARIDSGVTSGSSGAINVKLLLNSSFREAMTNPEFTEEEIMGMIHSFYIGQEVLAKFDSIQANLDKIEESSNIDSIISRTDSLIRELKKYSPN